MRKLRNIFLTLGGLAGVLIPVTLHAQSLGQPDPVQYTVAPEVPGPNQLTSIQVEGVGNFLGDATITWSVAGKTVQTGMGLTFFSFTTGALGTQTTVHVRIDSPTQGIIEHDFVFTPSSVNLIWEADTTVPPLYAGKALYSAGSGLRVVAFPTVIVRGTHISAQSLSYQWTVNDTPAASSGLGQNILTLQGDQLQPQEIVAVDVYLGSAKVGHGSITIPSTQPEMLFYYVDPLRGVVWDNALPQAIQLTGNEITVQAQPYYFSATAAQQEKLTYAWQLNGSDTTGPNASQGQLTLRQTGGGVGTAVLGVSLQNNNTDQFVQTASAELQLVFGNANTSLFSSLFGL